MDQTAAGRVTSLISLKRRSLLLGIGSVAFTAGLGAGAIAINAPGDEKPPSSFVELSRFVTGSRLEDPNAIGRAWSQLAKLDAGFPAAVDRLSRAVKEAQLASMAAFLASPLAKDAALMKTATTITSAFYLGFTGTPIDHRMKDDTGFVTFAGALMWRPTIDMTIIPTFARGKTDWWVAPPQGIPKPPGSAGQPGWQGSPTSPHSSKA